MARFRNRKVPTCENNDKKVHENIFHWQENIREALRLLDTDNPILFVLQDFIETLLEKIKAQLSPDHAFSQHSFEWHSRVIEALERHDAVGARQAMLADLASVEADLLKLGAEREKINWK